MVTIESIYEKDAEKAYRQFFEAEFTSRRLGSPGQWRGEGSRLLELPNPVRWSSFENLLHGRHPGSREALLQAARPLGQEAAWLLTFRASRNLSVAWGSAFEEEQCRIDKAFKLALQSTLRQFEGWMGANGLGEQSPDAPRMVFAAFRFGADEERRPDLRAHVFLFNLGLRPDGRVMIFPNDGVMKLESSLQRYHEALLYKALWREVGPQHPREWTISRDIGVPARLWTGLSPLQGVTSKASGREWPLARGDLSREQLFVYWQSCAEQYANQECCAKLRTRREGPRAWLNRLLDAGRRPLNTGTSRLEKARESLRRLVHRRENQDGPAQFPKAKERTITHSH